MTSPESRHSPSERVVASTLAAITVAALTGCGKNEKMELANVPSSSETPVASASQTPGEVASSTTPSSESSEYSPAATAPATYDPSATPDYTHSSSSTPESTTSTPKAPTSEVSSPKSESTPTPHEMAELIRTSFDKVLENYTFYETFKIVDAGNEDEAGETFDLYQSKLTDMLRPESFSKLPVDRQLLLNERYIELTTNGTELTLASNGTTKIEDPLASGGKGYAISPQDFSEAAHVTPRGAEVRRMIEIQRRRAYYTLIVSKNTSPQIQKNLSKFYVTAQENIDTQNSKGGLNSEDTPKFNLNSMDSRDYQMEKWSDGSVHFTYNGPEGKAWIIEPPVTPGGISAQLVKTKYGNFLTYAEKYPIDIPVSDEQK